MPKNTEKKKKRYHYDKWFLVILAFLLWQLAYILFSKYAINIPLNWTNYSFWLSMLAVIIAIVGWIWIFKIYIRSVRTQQDTERIEAKANYWWIRQVAIRMGMPFDEVSDKATADLEQLFNELKEFIEKKERVRIGQQLGRELDLAPRGMRTAVIEQCIEDLEKGQALKKE